MGLDMYLSKRTNIKNWDHKDKDTNHNITIERGLGSGIKKNRITDIIEEVAYWRKANMIHKWFEDNTDYNNETDEAVVYENQLKELMELCKEVLGKAILVDSDKVINGYTGKVS